MKTKPIAEEKTFQLEDELETGHFTLVKEAGADEWTLEDYNLKELNAITDVMDKLNKKELKTKPL